ncbi:MAG: methyltransferase domain-containing protein [Gallionella sp.]|jgi:SAM-dependent methyltransferase|nr:methyltransferase domain-containing protein [Gallionella sp.]
MALPQLHWDIEFLKNNPVLQDDSYGIPPELKRINYPLRLARYWFMYHLLREEAARKGALDVCEIGVDTGQMLSFMDAAANHGGERVALANWDAVDAVIKREALERAGYKHFYEVDLESAEFNLDADRQYDAMILLHVLEHLFDPEVLIAKLAPHLKPGGIMIGGFPSTPASMAQSREDKIRPTARKYGHVSVFSPQRVREMAAAGGLEVEFLSGAFFMRKKGFFLENCKWWLRFNLWFGGMFPGWPGELYFLLRKPR